MKKKTRAQKKYLEKQQDVLEAERRYAAVQQAHWAAKQIHAVTRQALDAAKQWQEELATELYRTVWIGKEQVAANRYDLNNLGAVRQALEAPKLEDTRYNHYQGGHVSTILNDLRWQVGFKDFYDRETDRTESKLVLGLTLNSQALEIERGSRNARLFLDRCREVFKDAWRDETLLDWLVKLDEANDPNWSINALAQRLAQRGQPALRQQAGAQPYKLAYMRGNDKNAVETQYVNRLLKAAVSDYVGVQVADTKTIASSDPYRLTVLAFDELVDVENLTAYIEGRDGSGGQGGYTSLPAQTPPGGGTSRHILHVFPAERNAALYEARLDYLLPDKVVMLLEDRDRFRLFVQAWAYGQAGGNSTILLHDFRIPDSAEQHVGLWVRRLSTGPFEGEADPLTLEPRTEPEHRWLTEPMTKPPLIKAAEAFLVGGVDKWQFLGHKLPIDDARVKQEIARQQAEFVARGTVGQNNPTLKTKIVSMQDDKSREEALLKLADYEHLQKMNTEISAWILRFEREMKQAQQRAESVQRKEAYAEAADQELDLHLMRLIQEFIADELRSLHHQIAQFKAPGSQDSREKENWRP
jgi:hypothetical protein